MITTHDTYLPSTSKIFEVFREELMARSATIRDNDLFDDGEYLMARAALPFREAIEGNDFVNGGVAILAHGPEIQIHPYVLRMVCTNGAILAKMVHTRQVARVKVDAQTVAAHGFDDAFARAEIANAIDACAEPTALSEWAEGARAAALTSADIMISFPEFGELARRLLGPTFLRHFEQRMQFERDEQPTACDLLNGITAVARDTLDPHRRWQLEVLGGAFPEWVSRAHAGSMTSVA